jgi:hypothetical protein
MAGGKKHVTRGGKLGVLVFPGFQLSQGDLGVAVNLQKELTAEELGARLLYRRTQLCLDSR